MYADADEFSQQTEEDDKVPLMDEVLPIVLAVPGKVQGQPLRKCLVGLTDSGSTTTWINKRALPPGISGYTDKKVTGSTLAGTFTSSEKVCIEDFILPEFNGKQVLPKFGANVFHADCRYDIIIGRDEPESPASL